MKEFINVFLMKELAWLRYVITFLVGGICGELYMYVVMMY